MRSINTAVLLAALVAVFTTGPACAGSFGEPLLSTTSIASGAASMVKLTVTISDPAYIAGSGNVQRLNEDGSVRAIVGVLHDDGMQGDVTAGDHVYTLDIPMNEASAGIVRFQVSAAYRQELKRTISGPVLLIVTASPPAIKAAHISLNNNPAGIAASALISADVDSVTQPLSIVLQKINANGTVLATLGTLHDDGADGDLTASDKTYSLRTVVLENFPGAILYRIAATFPGYEQTVFSEILNVAIVGSATSIQLTSPPSGAYLNTPVITVSGNVGDPAAQVALNGISAVLSGTSFNAAVPLNEGPNTITAVAINSGGSTTTSSIQVTLDTTAPKVVIYSPSANASTNDASITVSGMVNDIVVGTVNPEQATVIVNGKTAEVLNRSFIARDVALNVGVNTIQAIATDRAGNRATSTATVKRLSSAGGLKLISGNNQRASTAGMLSAPLEVALTNAQGAPISNKPVVFRVIGLDGTIAMETASGLGQSALAVNTDNDGKAKVYYRLGSRSGNGNVVEASSAGVKNTVEFVATGIPGSAKLIVVDSGSNQSGVVGQPLPLPFIAIVTDANNNRLANVPVTFEVKSGGGGFGATNLSTFQTVSDSDGRVAATLTLGPDQGRSNNVVEANFSGNLSYAAAFSASGLVPGPAAQTSISGVVLDNSNNPIPGVTVHLFQITQGSRSNIPQEMAAAVRTDAQGQFMMQQVPVGIFKLMVDGGTATRTGTWPTLDFDMITVSGQNNTLNMPIFLPELNPANRICVDENNGGILILPEVPGFELAVAPGAATFAGGSRSGCVSVTPVNLDKVPMAPAFGQQPRFVVTIQPVGTHFNPPARMTIPNVDGLTPRSVTEMYSYDHDLSAFVAIGSATVSNDGAIITSDIGAGVIKAGWHGGGNPNPTSSAGTCPACQQCQGSSCVPVADSPPPARATASPSPLVTNDSQDAVELGQFGENYGFGYSSTLSCSSICVAGGEKTAMTGDILPDSAWRIAVHTRAQVSGCAAITRTAANIARTTTHEKKHGALLMSVINNAKNIVGSIYASMSECNQAKNAAISQLDSDWRTMVGRQAQHTDFAGEMRYYFTCQAGTTVEVPSGVTY